MPQRVLDIVTRYGDRPFLIDSVNDQEVSFEEFHQLASSLAVVLRGQGICRGDRIAIILNNSVELVVLYFACLYLGAVAVPINPQLHKRDIEFILKCCGASVAVCSTLTKRLIDIACLESDGYSIVCLLPKTELETGYREPHIWSLNRASTNNIDDFEPFVGVSPNDLYTITFTSGTTSFPKGVAHKIDTLLKSAVVFNEELNIGTDNRFYHVLPMAYMAGLLNTLLCPFLAGASVVISRPSDARLTLDFWDSVIKYGVNTLWLVPAILSWLMRIDRDDAGLAYSREHIDTVCVGTAPLPLKLKRDFENKYGLQLFES
jgi:long-chain acyl-CoA synthetase